MSERGGTGRSWLVIVVVWLVLLGALAAGWRYGVAPLLRSDTAREEAVQRYDELAERATQRGFTPPTLPPDASAEEVQARIAELERRLTSATADDRPIDHRVALALDSFSGYAVLRSDDFQSRLADRRIVVDLVDDGADYPARLRSLADGSTPLAVFTVDALLRTAAATSGEPPATAVMVIDETVGADAVVARSSTTPNVDALNRPDARILAVPDSPSDTLARVTLANFALPELGDDPVQSVSSAAAAYEAIRSDRGEAPLAVALWEPYVSRALELPGVHVLIDSSRFRGYIVDVLVVQRRYLIENEPVVRAVVEAYLASAHRISRTPRGWDSLVREDARRLGEPLTPGQADRLVQGIWWKNTLENYAHFDLLPPEQAPGVATLSRVVGNLVGVLGRTDALERDLTDGRPATLYYAGILESMQRDGYHPAGSVVGAGDRETVREADEAPLLNDEQWAGLVPVGTVDTGRLVFARGTATLTGFSQRALDGLVDTLETWPNYYVRVRGHARSLGNRDANRQLAQERAEAAVSYLVEAGAPAARLRAVVSPELGTGGEAQAVTFEFGQRPY